MTRSTQGKWISWVVDLNLTPQAYIHTYACSCPGIPVPPPACRSLYRSDLWFMCAHGRPTLTPLIDMAEVPEALGALTRYREERSRLLGAIGAAATRRGMS